MGICTWPRCAIPSTPHSSAGLQPLIAVFIRRLTVPMNMPEISRLRLPASSRRGHSHGSTANIPPCHSPGKREPGRLQRRQYFPVAYGIAPGCFWPGRSHVVECGTQHYPGGTGGCYSGSKVLPRLGTYDIPILISRVRQFKSLLMDNGSALKYQEFNEGHSWGTGKPMRMMH